MAQNDRTFTPAEAGAVSGLGRKAIDNAIDKRLVPKAVKAAGRAGRGARHARLIRETDLVWIYVNSRAPGAIPRAERETAYARLAAAPGAEQLRVSELVYLDVGEARRQIEAGATALERAKARVVSDPEILSGEPVFKGTRVPIYDVAASLAKGISRERILAAYSVLDEESLDQARLYAEAFPPRGRPRGAPRMRPSLELIERTVVPWDPPSP